MDKEEFNMLRARLMTMCEQYGVFAPMVQQAIAAVLDVYEKGFHAPGRIEPDTEMEALKRRVSELESKVRELQRPWPTTAPNIEINPYQENPYVWPPPGQPWWEVFPKTVTYRAHDYSSAGSKVVAAYTPENSQCQFR